MLSATGWYSEAFFLTSSQSACSRGCSACCEGRRCKSSSAATIIHAAGYFLPEGGPIQPLHHGFLINYEEDSNSARQRFEPWLEEVIRQGLDAWRRTL